MVWRRFTSLDLRGPASAGVHILRGPSTSLVQRIKRWQVQAAVSFDVSEFWAGPPPPTRDRRRRGPAVDGEGIAFAPVGTGEASAEDGSPGDDLGSGPGDEAEIWNSALQPLPSKPFPIAWRRLP